MSTCLASKTSFEFLHLFPGVWIFHTHVTLYRPILFYPRELKARHVSQVSDHFNKSFCLLTCRLRGRFSPSAIANHNSLLKVVSVLPENSASYRMPSEATIFGQSTISEQITMPFLGVFSVHLACSCPFVHSATQEFVPDRAGQWREK